MSKQVSTSPSTTVSLGPGERLIDGRVFYSAAWLGETRSEVEVGHSEGGEDGRDDQGNDHDE